ELPRVDRRRVDRSEQQPGQAILLALEQEAALDAEEPGEDERHPEHARRERRCLLGPRIVRDAEHEQQQDAEHHEARDALAGAPLDPRLLAQDGQRATHPRSLPPAPPARAFPAALPRTAVDRGPCGRRLDSVPREERNALERDEPLVAGVTRIVI